MDIALPGQPCRDEVLLNGFSVPLPPGEWTVLANSSIKETTNPDNKGMSYFLGRIENRRMVGAVIVYSLRSPAPGTGFGEFKSGRSREALFASVERITAFSSQSCWLMTPYFTPPWRQWTDKSIRLPELTRAAARALEERGVAFAQDFVSVQFYRSEKWGLLDASYLFSPASDGVRSTEAFTFREADWFHTNIPRFPEKLAYVEKLKGWGAAFEKRFNHSFLLGQLEEPGAVTRH